MNVKKKCFKLFFVYFYISELVIRFDIDSQNVFVFFTFIYIYFFVWSPIKSPGQNNLVCFLLFSRPLKVNSRPAGGSQTPSEHQHPCLYQAQYLVQYLPLNKSLSLSSLFSDSFSFMNMPSVYCHSLMCGTHINVLHIDGHPPILISYSLIIIFFYYMDICDHLHLLIFYCIG